jgi:lipoyl(octanoyl) transferase
MGIKCSRWVTMHGFALNVNTDLDYFNNIIPCGIQNKQVTSLQKELGNRIPMADVKEKVKANFERVFGCELVAKPSEVATVPVGPEESGESDTRGGE